MEFHYLNSITSYIISTYRVSFVDSWCFRFENGLDPRGSVV